MNWTRERHPKVSSVVTVYPMGLQERRSACMGKDGGCQSLIAHADVESKFKRCNLLRRKVIALCKDGSGLRLGQAPCYGSSSFSPNIDNLAQALKAEQHSCLRKPRELVPQRLLNQIRQCAEHESYISRLRAGTIQSCGLLRPKLGHSTSRTIFVLC